MVLFSSGSVALNSPITVPIGWFFGECELPVELRSVGAFVHILQGETEA